jgi:HNH endonuclease
VKHPALPATAHERLWSRVDTAGDCWEWQGSRLPSGYGNMSVEGQRFYAHRLSVLLSGRTIPKGMVVMHSCYNPPCVRPSHLSVGTTAENRRDCADKGRNPTNGNQFKTRCKRDHDLAVTARLTGRGNQRVCTECERLRHQRRTAA